MNELLKDLEAFRQGGWTSHWIEEKLLLSATHVDGKINIPVPAMSDFVMHALAEYLAKDKGYVKVVRCGECRWWGGNHSEHLGKCSVCASRLEKGYGACYGRFGENVEGVLMKAHEFCSEGERKEGSNA